MSLDQLNGQTRESAASQFSLCCASHRWVEAMVAARPFASAEELRSRAEEIWRSLGEADFLEAFEAHPKIGDMASLRERFAATETLAAGEQSGAAGADPTVLARLADGNAAYERRFGFIFIVCATGKTAAEMCALLEARLPNERSQELMLAGEEQLKITLLRLEKLL